MRSIIYWHPFIYSLFMRLLCRADYKRRYIEIGELIEDNSSVIDVCCADCKLYGFLKEKNIKYLGLDYNPAFIKYAKGRGIKAELCNLYEDNMPKSDYIVIQASLYQFIPQHDKILRKLFDAANKYLIIRECVKSYSASSSQILSYIGKKLNNPGDGIKAHRFNIDILRKAVEPFRNNIVKEFYSANITDYIIVIKKGK